MNIERRQHHREFSHVIQIPVGQFEFGLGFTELSTLTYIIIFGHQNLLIHVSNFFNLTILSQFA